jgi:hypothetical protein
MSDSLALEIGETIQTGSINRAPSPAHDINPSTAASEKVPVSVSPHGTRSDSSPEKYPFDDGVDGDDEEEDIPYSVIRPLPRRASLPPLPDLRFEQSYLASIAAADTKWRVAYITIRDQVMVPLLQGMVWTLVLHGWRYWNRTAQIGGNSLGARVRRWWYRTNNWPLEGTARRLARDQKLARDMGDVSSCIDYSNALADEIEQYYQNQNSGD